jgi:hypothetical protein
MSVSWITIPTIVYFPTLGYAASFFPQTTLSAKAPELYVSMLPPSLRFLPDASIREKKCGASAFTGCITQVSFIRLLPYLRASVGQSTKLGNTPYRLDLFASVLFIVKNMDKTISF